MSVVLIEVEIDASGQFVDPPIPDPISAEPGAYLVFVIVNNDAKKHKVSISPSDFKKKKPTDPDDPIDSLAIAFADVEAFDSGALLLHVKGKGHFPMTAKKGKKGSIGATYTYKYTIRATGVTALDPDIEINN